LLLLNSVVALLVSWSQQSKSSLATQKAAGSALSCARCSVLVTADVQRMAAGCTACPPCTVQDVHLVCAADGCIALQDISWLQDTCKVVRGAVTKLGSHTADVQHLETGAEGSSSIDFDYCIICCGALFRALLNLFRPGADAQKAPVTHVKASLAADALPARQVVPLLLAGADYSSAFCKDNGERSFDARLARIKQVAAQVQAARRILVVGGGIVRFYC
jgi:hypothetical protein